MTSLFVTIGVVGVGCLVSFLTGYWYGKGEK